MKIEMGKNIDWLREKAAEEDNGIISAGGLIARLRAAKADSEQCTDRIALAKLIKLRRRALLLSVAELAARGSVEISTVVQIENGLWDFIEPETIRQLARILALPEQRLLQLAGLAQIKDSSIHEAASKFATCSEPLGKLTPEESDALEEFVRFLVKE